MPERPEIYSTSRPSATRLWGFLCLAAGALLAGLGATLDWAVVGFPQDVKGSLDVAVKGTDVWEGKVVLAASVLALVVLLTLRVVRRTQTRRILAFGIVTLGALVLALALSIAIRPDARFGGSERPRRDSREPIGTDGRGPGGHPSAARGAVRQAAPRRPRPRGVDRRRGRHPHRHRRRAHPRLGATDRRGL